MEQDEKWRRRRTRRRQHYSRNTGIIRAEWTWQAVSGSTYHEHAPPARRERRRDGCVGVAEGREVVAGVVAEAGQNDDWGRVGRRHDGVAQVEFESET